MIRRLLGLLPAAALAVALFSPSTPLLARIVIVVLSGMTLWDPAAGLLLTAGFAPLGSFAIALDRVADFRLTEVILLSFIAAWLLRRQPNQNPEPRTPNPEPGTRNPEPRLPHYAWAAAWLFAVLLVSLCVGLSSQLLRYQDALRIDLATIATHYFGYADPTGVSDAARMLEGFAIVGAAMELFRWRPSLARSLPVALALSTMAAAATSVLLWFGIGPEQVLSREAIIGYRFAAHVLDLNAAGSQFAMILCLSLGMAMRERGVRRNFWIASSIGSAVGLWMSGSRSAEAAAGLVIPLAFLWAVTASWPRTRRMATIGGVLGVLVIFGVVRAWQIEHDPTYTASGFRQQFVMSSFRVIGTHPYLGIGPGRYFRDSPNFLTPQLAWSYGSENAHNNYLQITTEEGIIGFFVYATFFVGALSLAFRALKRNGGTEAKTDWRLLGATAGVIAFLGTCLMGHPLLVREVATVFFAQLALAASLGGSALLNHLSVGRGRLQPAVESPPNGGRYLPGAKGGRYLVAAGTIAFAVLPAWTLEKPLVPVHLEEVDGMYYGDEGTAEGVPFHWTRNYGTVYAPATARTIDLPLRSPIAALTKEPTLVEITVGGQTMANVLVEDKWKMVRLNLQSPEPPLQFTRINLRVNRTARVAELVPVSTDRSGDAWSLRPEAKNDQRVVGVQVGGFQILLVAWEFVPRPAGTRATTP